MTKFSLAKGGSQVVDSESSNLLLTEITLDIFEITKASGFEMICHWVPRASDQAADDLSKFVDRMDFSLTAHALRWVQRWFGFWDIDRFAAPHNTTCIRFNALFDSSECEAANAFAQDWHEGTSFVLPDFHVIDRVLDRIERDNATAILVLPEWTYKPWWRRLHSNAWASRIAIADYLPENSLVANAPNREHCFFGERFTSRLLVLRTQPLR